MGIGLRRILPTAAIDQSSTSRTERESTRMAEFITVAKVGAIAEGKGFQPEAYAGLGLLFKEKAEGLGGAAELAEENAAFAEAAKNLAVAVKQLAGAPDAIVVYQLLGLVYERQKKFKEAIAVYEEFLRVFPDVSEAAAVESFIVQIKKQMAEQE